MRRLSLAGVLGLIAVGCLVLGGKPLAAQDKEERAAEKAEHKDHPDTHDGLYEKCAKACTQCLRECESCALHCGKLLAEGKSEHRRTLGLCLDCSDVCTAAARITSRHGPMSSGMCGACAGACDSCGKQCAKFKTDEHMARCAKACRDCAQACQEMVRHLNQRMPKAEERDKGR
jgi:hypothetical protein